MFFKSKTDHTVTRTADMIRETVPSIQRGGYTWYDIADQGFAAEVCLLRNAGAIAHHPVVHTLIRFEEGGGKS